MPELTSNPMHGQDVHIKAADSNNGFTKNELTHAVLGTPGSAIYIPASGSRVVAGNFGSSGAKTTVYIKTITAATSATLVIAPVTLAQTGMSL